MDKYQQLYDRLDAGLQGHYSAWSKLPPDTLMMLSKEITAIRDAHEYLTGAHSFEPSEVEYLLSLDDPLQAAADKWMKRMNDLSDFSFTLDELFRHAEISEKESVLGKLRGKSAEPSKSHSAAKEQEER